MSYCLPKRHAEAFKAALRAGKIVPEHLVAMTSAERRTFFEGIIGKENAEAVNAAFESKMLLKDQKRGFATWARSLAGLKDEVKRDFISKVNKLDKVLDPEDEHAFLADLAAQKIGATVTADEAKAISQGAKLVSDLKEAGWNEKAEKWSSEKARLEYGTAYVKYQDYVGTLLRDANAQTFKEWIRDPKAIVMTVASVTKGLVASLDNSFFGRQGIKTLFTNPDIWAKAFLKSWPDIGKSLAGRDPMAALKADVFSRPNAMNGKYRNGKFAIGIDFEEAFPTSLPEKIPIFGRLYKASETAFNGAALRMRADLADRIIPLAEKSGVDMSKPGKQAEAIGHLVNAMTGRGDIGKMSGDTINAAFFSIRFLKSNLDTLTAHMGGHGFEAGPGRNFARKQAAKNLAMIVGGMAAVLFTAEQLWPGSTEPDPRSANFGKIKIGNTRIDITGGMGSIVTLASRLIPTLHDGKWGWWSKSSVTGQFTNLHSGKFGRQTALDVIEDFWEGKLSPLFGQLRDIWKGETFNGQKITPTTVIADLITPISYQTLVETMNDPKAAPLLAVMIADGLGFGANTYSRARPPARLKQPWEFMSEVQ